MPTFNGTVPFAVSATAGSPLETSVTGHSLQSADMSGMMPCIFTLPVTTADSVSRLDGEILGLVYIGPYLFITWRGQDMRVAT